MKNYMGKKLLILGLAALASGCSTLDISSGKADGLTRSHIGRHESYLGSKDQIEKKIYNHQLHSWNSGTNLYAEGRTYGMHFAEFSTDTNLLDGCATDGCTKAPDAKKR